MDRGNSTPYEENSASPALPAQPSALHLAPPSALPALPFGNNSASPALPSGGSYVTMAAECEGKGGKNMAIDMKRKKQYDNEWQRQNCIRINFTIRNNTDTAKGVMMLKEQKIPVTPYIEKALRKQLIADGYLRQSIQSNETEE